MNQFTACMKKDFLETTRTYKFWVMMLCAVGMAVLTLLLLVVMDIVGISDIGNIAGEDVAILFEKSYFNSISFFSAFITSYFLLIMIIIYSNSISKEITTKKWLTPVSAGIKPRNMILSKISTTFYSVMVALIIGCLVHFVITILYCSPSPDGFTGTVYQISDLLYCYAMILVFTAFMCLLTIILNAIIKNGWIVATITIVFLILVPEILSSIMIGDATLISYSPFLFMYQALPESFSVGMTMPAVTTAQWITSSLVSVGIVLALLIGAIFSNKVRAYEK